MFEYNEAVQQLVKIAKEEKDKLDHQIVLATAQLTHLKNEHIRLEGVFSQNQRDEDQRFKNNLSKKNNQLIEQEHKINMLYKDLQQRDADLKVKEERMMKVEEERIKIGNDRVNIEKMRVNANILMDEASRKISEAHAIMAQANSRLSQATDVENKYNIRNQELSQREDKLQFDIKAFKVELEHLQELKAFVEPKIKEVQEMEINIENARKEITIKHQEVINISEENKIALKALEDKKAKLDKKELDLNSREEDLKRKIILADVKK